MQPKLNPEELSTVIELLKRGELVGLPTETVYGLAADASNPNAVKKIFAAKERPASQPVIVHIADANQLKHWAKEIPETAEIITEKFWPGPLTLILKKAEHVDPIITAGKDTVGLRAPSHSIAQQVLQAFEGGLACPSANRFCHISPTEDVDVKEELGKRVSYVIDGGSCEVGLESTILDLTQDVPTILRPGMITAEMIKEVTGIDVIYAKSDTESTPGNLEKHYSPNTSAYLMNIEEIIQALDSNEKLGLIMYSDLPDKLQNNVHCKHLAKNAAMYAAEIYHCLRELDRLNLDRILIETPPQTEDWLAVNDRLKRAAG